MRSWARGVIGAVAIVSTSTMLPVGAASASTPTAGYHQLAIGYDNMCVDEYGNNAVDGAAIDQWACNGYANQEFQFLPAANGYFELQVENSGQDVTVANGSTSAGAYIIQEPANGSPASLWMPLQQSDGTYELQNQNSGMCLDVYGAGANLGQQLDQWPCKNSTATNQDFGLLAPAVPSYPTGYRQLTVDYDSLCVDVWDNSSGVGDLIDQWTCNSQANQQFQFVPVANGYGELQAENSGQDIAVANSSTTAGAGIVQQPPSGAADGLWLPIRQPDGTWSFQNQNSGLCLDVYGAGANLGQQLDQWQCKNAAGTNQDFGVAAVTGTVPCANPPSYQYFSGFGDPNYYFLAPGGDFHTYDANPWRATGGAYDMTGGDPWDVTKDLYPGSAYIPSGGSETSWPVCVNTTQTALRFFYRSPGVAGADLQVEVAVTSGSNTAVNTVDIGGGTSGWQVSQIMNLPAIYDPSGEETITISFTTAGTPAAWQVDDTMLDPFTSH
jgi:hypothetical protein